MALLKNLTNSKVKMHLIDKEEDDQRKFNAKDRDKKEREYFEQQKKQREEARKATMERAQKLKVAREAREKAEKKKAAREKAAKEAAKKTRSAVKDLHKGHSTGGNTGGKQPAKTPSGKLQGLMTAAQRDAEEKSYYESPIKDMHQAEKTGVSQSTDTDTGEYKAKTAPTSSDYAKDIAWREAQDEKGYRLRETGLFPQDFVNTYEKWNEKNKDINRRIAENGTIKAELEEIQESLENELKSFNKYSDYKGTEGNIDWEKLIAVGGDLVSIGMYASNPLFWDRLPETVTATGYDATDLVNNTSFEGLGDYLKEKREAKIDRALLRTQNDNQQDLIDTLSSRDNNNAIFDYTLEDLENKMERKYPGLKEKYEWYLNGDEEPTLKPWP